MSLSFSERFCGWREIFTLPERRRLLKTPLKENLFLDLTRRETEAHREGFGGDLVNLMLYLDVKGLLPGDMLTKVDRMSMVNSLEVRVPFLDYTVVEYVFSLRGNTKLRAKGGKAILLETFKRLLPPLLHSRPKWGFEMPIGAWLRKELRFLIDDYLREETIRRQGLFRYEVISRLVRDHMSCRRDTSWQLWNLIVFQHWYEQVML
jgi:asparagine synthase (glutamine-hydrolysing)